MQTKQFEDIFDPEKQTPKKTYSINQERMFVRKAVPCPDNDGEYFFLLSPVDPKDHREQVKAKIDMKNPAHRDVMQALASNKNGITTATLKYDKNDEGKMPLIAAIVPGLSNEQRKIMSGNEHVSTWTHELDDSMDTLLQYRAFNHASEEMKKILRDEIQGKRIMEKAKEYILLKEPGLKEQASFEFPSSLLSALSNSDRFDTTKSFEEQFSGDKEDRIPQYKNYAIQKMLVREVALTSKSMDPDGVEHSIYEDMHERLIESGLLHSGHPTHVKEDFKDLSVEKTQQMAAILLQGMMDIQDSKAHNKEHDAFYQTDQNLNSGEEFNFLNKIKDEILLEGKDQQNVLNQYLETAAKLSKQGQDYSVSVVSDAVDRSMQKGFERKQPETIGVLDRPVDKSIMITDSVLQSLDQEYGRSAIHI